MCKLMASHPLQAGSAVGMGKIMLANSVAERGRRRGKLLCQRHQASAHGAFAVGPKSARDGPAPEVGSNARKAPVTASQQQDGRKSKVSFHVCFLRSLDGHSFFLVITGALFVAERP